MKNPAAACSQEVTVANEAGLHARSAASIAKLARHARFRVWIRKGDTSADAKDVMDVLSLACPKGSLITLSVEDLSDKKVLTRLVRLVQNGFEEQR